MHIHTLVLAVAVCLSLAACGKSTEEMKVKEEMEAKSEVRMKFRKEYNACITKAKDDADKIKECDRLLQAADMVK